MPLSKGDRVGPYEILALIGKGGMGEVYRAHDPRLRRDVAIKVSSQHFDECFERERSRPGAAEFSAGRALRRRSAGDAKKIQGAAGTGWLPRPDALSPGHACKVSWPQSGSDLADG